MGGSGPGDIQYHWPVTDVGKLLQYSTIIWNAGDLDAFTITPEDETVLQSWIQQPGKNRNLWIGGNNGGAELMANNGAVTHGTSLGFTVAALWLGTTWDTSHQR